MDTVIEALTRYWGLDWIQPLVALIGTMFVARKMRVGWLVGLFANVLWLALALLVGMWGNVLWSIPWFFVFIAGYWWWKADEHTCDKCEKCSRK